MFDTLSVLYLFLGGTGAGALAVSSALDLFWVRQPIGRACSLPGPSVRPLYRLLDLGMLLGVVCLAVGVVCLVLDVGRADRILLLFLSPSPTLLTVGSYALALLGGAGVFLASVRFLYLPHIGRTPVVLVEAAAIVLSAVVMLYTGLLLQTIGGVALWASPFVPLLFFLSSLSSGMALVFAASLFVEAEPQGTRMLRRLIRADIVIIALEALAAIAFFAVAKGSGHPGVLQSFGMLSTGSVASVWWIGFGICGLAAPLLLEVGCAKGIQGLRTAVALVAVFVLVGAFCLRWSIVEAGTHRELVLEDVVGADTAKTGALGA